MSLFHHLSSVTDVRGRFKNTLIECFNIFGFHLILTCKVGIKSDGEVGTWILVLWGYVPSVAGYRTMQYGMYVVWCVCGVVSMWCGVYVVWFRCGVVWCVCGVVRLGYDVVWYLCGVVWCVCDVMCM